MELDEFCELFADALAGADAKALAHKAFQPGIGPFGEADAVRLALAHLQELDPKRFGRAQIKRQPDLLIPELWQIEFKLVRPFGDNGKQAENWSQNVLHPYPGNTSSLGDCIKLMASEGSERKAVVVFGYEHTECQISLEPCIRGFEILADKLLGIQLSSRQSVIRKCLLHPVHQVLHVFGWELSA
ncbi:MAG: hypothetical protein ABIV13_02220 [Fimbriimonadales bacterium]